jgi:sigma-B regulation protein RsbU (phosphoserine phosphatase)
LSSADSNVVRLAGIALTGLPPLLHCGRFTVPSAATESHSIVTRNDLPFLAMVLIDTQLTASEVLRTFHRDEPFLFLGAAFTTVGILSAAFCVLRRRFDALLVCLAVFAILYGQRLWLQAGLLRLTVPENSVFNLLRAAIDPLVPIPAFFFFLAAGLLGRGGRIITYVLSALFLSLVVATLVFGPLQSIRDINNALVIGALMWMVLQALKRGSANRDFVVLRRGLFCFVAFALWDNIVGYFVQPSKVEPYGFAIFLATLGYVAARRTLDRDHQLGEIQKELELARNIQLSLLPADCPNSTNFCVVAKYVPMTAVAGDLYEFLVADDRQVGVLIADVSGHGVPAALIASMVKMAASSQRANATHPALLMAGMNAALCGNTQGQFVTAAYVYLDAEASQLRYAAAGHPSMLLLRDKRVTEIMENGLLLAASTSATYTEITIPLVPADRLLLYTDGLTEARNAKGELFGEESLAAAFKNTSGVMPSVAASRIIAAVEQWASSQDDDLTVLVCDYLCAVCE